ncbi:hypothetical protein D3C73_1598970 [compost metagenome]
MIHMVQYFRNMHNSDRFAFTRQPSAYIKQTAHICADQNIGPGIRHTLAFLINHLGRDFRHFDGKGSAEPAAVIAVLERLQL